jgi:hypothetical protein
MMQEVLLGSGGVLRGNDGEDRGDRFEGVVRVILNMIFWILITYCGLIWRYSKH